MNISTPLIELAVGVNAAPGLTQAFPRQIYNPPSVVLYTCCPFAVPFADKLDTKVTLATALAFAAIDPIIFPKFPNDVILLIFANAFVTSLKFTTDTFASLLSNIPNSIVRFANLTFRFDKSTARIFANSAFRFAKFTARTFANSALSNVKFTYPTRFANVLL